MKNRILSHSFLDIRLQKLSYVAVSIIKWLINYYFWQPLKKSEISITNLFAPLLQMKLFLRNNIAFNKKCTVEVSISCTISFLLLCGWLSSEAAVWRSSGKYVLLYDEKSLEKFQQRCPLFSEDAGYRSPMLIKMNLFTSIFQWLYYVLVNISQFLWDFQNSFLQNIRGWLLPCAISNPTRENWFLFI